MTPTPGRSVLYVVARHDLEVIKQALGDRGMIVEASPEGPAALVWEGNPIKVGVALPFQVTEVFLQPGQAYAPGLTCVNGKLTVDGPGPDVWLTSRTEGTAQGTWRWPQLSPPSK